MKQLLRALILPALLLASCGMGAAAPPATTPTVAPATPTASAASVTATPGPSPLATVTSPSPATALSECTSITATTRQVVERLFALSTSNDGRAVTDCYAKSYRDRNPNFAAGADQWSRLGPANDLVITFVDVVNGCDRFHVTAQMQNNPGWMGGQAYSVGPESGRPRIHGTGSALPIASLTTVRCP